ncbi:small heat shock protein [Lactarius hengduanensis]|nr:small heat shock protein [Lactarius hengduanensis]
MSLIFNDYSAPFDRFFDDVLNPRALRHVQHSDVFRPRMDIHHDDKSNTVCATFELPGLQKEDVSIDVNNNILTVSGETKQSTERNEEGYALRERRYGKFSRSLSLPQGLKNDDIKATMNNGCLNVVFPKSVPDSTPAKITIG